VNESEYAPIILQTMHKRSNNPKNQPFFISLIVEDLFLHNCMLDSRASTNVMSLKVMECLGLKTSRLYMNICAMDSREVKVCGLIKDLQVFLATHQDIFLVMDVVVIDVPMLGECFYPGSGLLTLEVVFRWIYHMPLFQNFRVFQSSYIEYEAFLLGLNLAKDLGIKILKIISDYDLVVSQVKGLFAFTNERLKRYMDVVDIMVATGGINLYM
jgi:hypothetical protein